MNPTLQKVQREINRVFLKYRDFNYVIKAFAGSVRQKNKISEISVNQAELKQFQIKGAIENVIKAI